MIKIKKKKIKILKYAELRKNSLDNSNKYIWTKGVPVNLQRAYTLYVPQSCLHIVSRYFLRIFSRAISCDNLYICTLCATIYFACDCT